jgi:2-polyprenyl-3-methyl-5-hydroxy-6-metoxy-1,4-benzoquinol methylase
VQPHPVQWTPDKIERFWSWVSRDPSFGDQYFTRQVGHTLIRLLNSRIGLTGRRILDYGCGPGYLLRALHDLRIDCAYTGIDHSATSIDIVNEFGPTLPQFHRAQKPVSMTDALGEAFDIIICCEVIEHLSDDALEDLLVFCRRHLRDDGYLIMTTPNKERLHDHSTYCPDCGAYFHRWQHVRSWSQDTLTSYLKARGFSKNSTLQISLRSSPGKTSRATLMHRLLGNPPDNLVSISQV